MKIREREYLDLARSLLPTLPSGGPEASEGPDFLIQTDDGLVGIEVTCFAWPGKGAHLKKHRYRPILPSDLQRILDKKARQSAGYFIDVRSTWLLVVLDRKVPRCIGWVTPPLLVHAYTSPFAGVGLLESNVRKGWELPVLVPPSGKPAWTVLTAVTARRDAILAAARRRGARNVRLFGSVARGDARPDSDVDFLVDLHPGRSLLDLGGLLNDLEHILRRNVNLVTTAGLRPRLRESVLKDARPL